MRVGAGWQPFNKGQELVTRDFYYAPQLGNWLRMLVDPDVPQREGLAVDDIECAALASALVAACGLSCLKSGEEPFG